MKIIRSPLVLKNFFILKNEMKFIPSRKKINIQEVYDHYPIELDYFIKAEEQDNYQIFMNLLINRETPELPGCSIQLDAVGIFHLNKSEDLKENDCKHLINFSAVSILINSIRTYIISLTTFSPMGKYTLPAVDMNLLLADKVKSVQQKMAQEPQEKYEKKVRRKT